MLVCNGQTGVHCVQLSVRQAHTGKLVRQVLDWKPFVHFFLVHWEGDVANWEVIMKIVATVALLHLCLYATGEFLLPRTAR